MTTYTDKERDPVLLRNERNSKIWEMYLFQKEHYGGQKTATAKKIADFYGVSVGTVLNVIRINEEQQKDN